VYELSALTIGFQERADEVQSYLDFLSTMEACAQQGPPRFEGAQDSITVQQRRILYSSVYLQLYNLVEATMAQCIDAVAGAARKDGKWKPSDLALNMRTEWVRSAARTDEGDMSPANRLKHALEMCNHLVGSLPISQFEIGKGGGGNWDDSAIEKMSQRFGLQLAVSPPIYSAIKQPFRNDLGALALVKDLRNQLAHGSISFAQCAAEETVGRLIELKKKTVDYLEEVVRCFVGFIESHAFILPDLRT
jgi:hypothetical protein